MQKEVPSNLIHGLALLFLFLNICLLLVILAPAGHYDLANVYKSAEVRSAEVETIAAPAEIPISKPHDEMVLEWKLVDTYNDGNWRVEKYQEYEKQFDNKGKIIKETPTSNYNYLRYWRY